MSENSGLSSPTDNPWIRKPSSRMSTPGSLTRTSTSSNSTSKDAVLNNLMLEFEWLKGEVKSIKNRRIATGNNSLHPQQHQKYHQQSLQQPQQTQQSHQYQQALQVVPAHNNNSNQDHPAYGYCAPAFMTVEASENMPITNGISHTQPISSHTKSFNCVDIVNHGLVVTNSNTTQKAKLSDLAQTAQNLIDLSVTNTTKQQYSVALHRYINFCQSLDLLSFPLHQQNLVLYASDLSNTLSYAAINTHLSALKFFSHKYGYPGDFGQFRRLYMVLRGIKRSTDKLHRKKKRDPITPDLLHKLHFYLFSSHRHYSDKCMLWAAMVCAFFGFLRISEFTSDHAKSYKADSTLCIDDVTQQSNTYTLHIKSSKTDPFRFGVNVRLASNNSILCPVQAISSYLKCHPTGKGPLFTFINGHFLTRQSFSRVLQELLPNNHSISTHSFRIGAATTAASIGLPRWLIKSLGRWNSDCFRQYIRVPEETIQQVSCSLIKHSGSYNVFDPDLS